MNVVRERRLLIIDDHPLTRRGIADIISREGGLAVAGETGSLPEARDLLAQVQPDLVLTDLRLHQQDALDFIRDCSSLYGHLPVMVVSMLDELTYAKRCLDAGAAGFVSKSASPEMLLDAISEVLDGNLWVSKDVTRFLLGNGRHRSGVQKELLAPAHGLQGLGIDSLSNRELQVFRLTGEGLPTRNIAEALSISPRTVESHKEHIKEKLNLTTAAELATKATLWLQGQL